MYAFAKVALFVGIKIAKAMELSQFFFVASVRDNLNSTDVATVLPVVTLSLAANVCGLC